MPNINMLVSFKDYLNASTNLSSNYLYEREINAVITTHTLKYLNIFKKISLILETYANY